MIVRRNKPLSQIFKDLEERVGPHAYARHDIHLERETYAQDRKRIVDQLAGHQPKEIAGVKVVRVRSDDGFKFYLEDGSWVLFRTSGTEALIRIYSEARDAAAVEARLAAIEHIVGLKKEVGAAARG
jgi:phosphomannomutase